MYVSVRDPIFLWNAIVVIPFGLSLISGGIVNVAYASENRDRHNIDCSFHNAGLKYCSDL